MVRSTEEADVVYTLSRMVSCDACGGAGSAVGGGFCGLCGTQGVVSEEANRRYHQYKDGKPLTRPTTKTAQEKFMDLSEGEKGQYLLLHHLDPEVDVPVYIVRWLLVTTAPKKDNT